MAVPKASWTRLGAGISVLGGVCTLAAAVCCTVTTSIYGGGDPECSAGAFTVCQTGAESDPDCGLYSYSQTYADCWIYTPAAGETAWMLCEGGPPSLPGIWKMVHRSGEHCCWIKVGAFNGGFHMPGTTYIDNCNGPFCGNQADPAADCPPQTEFPAEL